MAQAADSFEAPYMFLKSDVMVVIRHSLEKNIRHKAGHKHQVDGDGGYGKLARFTAQTRDRNGNTECKFQNNNSGDYLRIHKDEVDVAGKGGKFCWFRVHMQNVGVVKLESAEHAGHYIAVDKNGVRIGKGGPWCRMHVYREGPPPKFSKPYFFMKENTVVIEHRDRQHLRVMSENDRDVDIDGGKGGLAHWVAYPEGNKVRLKNTKNGKYLRIKDGAVECAGGGGQFTIFKVHPVDAPNHVRLESHKHPGEFVMLAPAKHKLKVGNGQDKRSFFTFYRE